LDEQDLKLVNSRRGDHNRLGIALQLGCVRFLGTFITDLLLVPTNAQWFVAHQLDLSDVAVLKTYAKRDNTRTDHAILIRDQYQYREFTWPWSFRLSRLLYTRSWISNERPSLLFDLATSWLIQNKVILPGASTLTRLIAEIRDRASNRLWDKLSAIPTPEQIVDLEILLEPSEGRRTSWLDHYRKGATTISGPAFNQAVERYQQLKSFGIGTLDFIGIPPVRFKSIARHAGMISVYKIARMPKNKRIAILLAFVKAFEIIALDDALDVLDLLITNIAGEAKKLGQKKRLRTLKDLDKSALALAEVCSLLLDDNMYGESLKEDLSSNAKCNSSFSC
jgi:hypothetical protein